MGNETFVGPFASVRRGFGGAASVRGGGAHHGVGVGGQHFPDLCEDALQLRHVGTTRSMHPAADGKPHVRHAVSRERAEIVGDAPPEG